MYIQVNDINLYYEVSGSGKPIILLHGNGEDHTIFDVLIKELSLSHQVFAVDSRNHGQSDKSTNCHYEVFRDDIIDFIKKLKLQEPIIYGFSDGAIIALLIAIKEPTLISKMILSGANYHPHGLNFKDYYMYKVLYQLNKDPLLRMMLKEPNISLEELHNIKLKTHIIVGEKDCIKISHTLSLKNAINASTLEIIKGEDHSSYIIHSPKLYPIIKKYL